MKVYVREIKGELQPYFLIEKRGNLWFGDLWYWAPKKNEVKKFLEISWTDKRTYITTTWDCDDYALKLLADCRDYTRWLVEMEIVKKANALPWAFCEVWSESRNGRRHALNAVLTSDSGLFLIEPQTDKMWKPEVGEDTLIFARG